MVPFAVKENLNLIEALGWREGTPYTGLAVAISGESSRLARVLPVEFSPQPFPLANHLLPVNNLQWELI